MDWWKIPQEQLQSYLAMPPEQRAALPGHERLCIIRNVTGQFVSVIYADVERDPVTVAQELQARWQTPAPRRGPEPRDLRSEQFFHNTRRGGYR